MLHTTHQSLHNMTQGVTGIATNRCNCNSLEEVRSPDEGQIPRVHSMDGGLGGNYAQMSSKESESAVVKGGQLLDYTSSCLQLQLH